MRKTFTTAAAAAAICALVALPASAQSSGAGSSGSGGSQQGGSSSGSGATDQQGSTHGAQPASGGTGQSGSGQTGTSGQRGTGQSGAATAAGAQGRSTAGARGKASAQDRAFIREAAAGGMAEVELGRLATQKAARSEVKEFGQMMVDDHSKANTQLMTIAQEEGVTAPATLEPEHEATRDRLSKLSGAAFDRAYMQDMVKDHQKDVASFRKHAASATNPELEQFATATLPTLEKHLQRAQELNQLVGGSGTARGTSGASSEATGANDREKAGTSGSETTPPR